MCGLARCSSRKIPCQTPSWIRPVGHRDRELDLGQGTFDVRRHVVGPLVVVAIECGILRHEAAQKRVEIAQYVG